MSLPRRDFHKLTVAALAGVVASSCKSSGDSGGTAAAEAEAASPLLSDPHVCRGLNTCKGKGAGGSNECAGMGECATATAHSCHGMNECAGQGGCAGTAGQNACKGEGGCGVPLKDEAWSKVRPMFEEAANGAGVKVGAAPAKADQ